MGPSGIGDDGKPPPGLGSSGSIGGGPFWSVLVFGEGNSTPGIGNGPFRSGVPPFLGLGDGNSTPGICGTVGFGSAAGGTGGLSAACGGYAFRSMAGGAG